MHRGYQINFFDPILQTYQYQNLACKWGLISGFAVQQKKTKTFILFYWHPYGPSGDQGYFAVPLAAVVIAVIADFSFHLFYFFYVI